MLLLLLFFVAPPCGAAKQPGKRTHLQSGRTMATNAALALSRCIEC